MKIELQSADKAIVTLGVRLEEDEIVELMEECQKLFRKKVGLILFDFSKMESIRSSAAAVFVALVGTASMSGTKIAIINPQKSVSDVFEILGVSKVIPLFSTVGEAVESLTLP